jgi:hypothetical protein
MTDEAKEARRKYNREYMRKWRAAHPDKVAKNIRAYWERKGKQMDKIDLVTAYNTLLSKYTKLCDFLQRVEEGSSPIHDDYPVGELYERKAEMEQELKELKGRMGNA